ncbi:hypothetical protein FB451DRAFT_1434298 [Mycena latifolia]|nr:hypothetical protein FB451DRAFT_1434298 [Mycena latifolia]
MREKDYLRFAVMQSRGAIIAAQVGAAKSTEKQRLEQETDSTRADQVLLTLARVYLHFVDHPETAVSSALVKRIEKRWADYDQPLYLVALIFNPFEATSLVVHLYHRMMDYPENDDSAAGKDPVAVWTALQSSGSCKELAQFAILVLMVVINQAACERVFSQVMNDDPASKANGGIQDAHLREGPNPMRDKRKNRSSVDKPLTVPYACYRDLLEDQDDEDEGEHDRALVSSPATWKVEMAKWIASVREADVMEVEDPPSESESPNIKVSNRKWFKTSFAVLFGGPDAKRDSPLGFRRS